MKITETTSSEVLAVRILQARVQLENIDLAALPPQAAQAIQAALTGLQAPVALAVDAGMRAQQAAEAHLAACYEAEEQLMEDAENAPESPACGPFCACETCLIRETLYIAWPILEAEAMASALERSVLGT